MKIILPGLPNQFFSCGSNQATAQPLKAEIFEISWKSRDKSEPPMVQFHAENLMAYWWPISRTRHSPNLQARFQQKKFRFLFYFRFCCRNHPNKLRTLNCRKLEMQRLVNPFPYSINLEYNYTSDNRPTTRGTNLLKNLATETGD